MIVFKVKHKTLGSDIMCWRNLIDALEEIKLHMGEGDIGDTVEITIDEITEEEYGNLPESKGY